MRVLCKPAEWIDKIRELQQKTGLPKDFEDKGISAEDFKKTIQAVAIDQTGATYPLAKELIESIGTKGGTAQETDKSLEKTMIADRACEKIILLRTAQNRL